MHQTIIVAIYSPLAIVGMILIITWGMNAAGSRREGYGQDVSQQIDLCEICPMKPSVNSRTHSLVYNDLASESLRLIRTESVENKRAS
jgi:hypothetical protein